LRVPKACESIGIEETPKPSTTSVSVFHLIWTVEAAVFGKKTGDII
jgi:hypothetical protein